VNPGAAGGGDRSGGGDADRKLEIGADKVGKQLEERVAVDGRHLRRGGQPHRVRGVTYGSFRRRFDGSPFPDRSTIKRDLDDIAGLGLNTVRTYDLPPADLFDAAEAFDLQVIVGINHHDWRLETRPGRAARRRVRTAGLAAVREALDRVGGNPNVLAVSIGNEVPADLVRVHGVHAVQDQLSELAAEVHRLDPEMLVTYSSYPTTEYLAIDGLDICSFNVFLEDQASWRAYVRHLMTVAGDRPLLLTELGLASEAHGEAAQAELLDWQLRTIDETGCAGATVFAWTDEWAVADKPVDGWGFGITTQDRAPKPAADVVRRWAERELVDLRPTWPRVSVIVCAYNEERTIDACLGSLAACEYPDLEVIVCDDGSTDATLSLIRRHGFRVLALDHGGLSRARNAGLAAATGDVIAYLDADAQCDPQWPYYLALSLEDDGVVATGGPNLPVATAGFVERAVALSPGNPIHVLLADDRAEHVPGCNMAFERDALEAIGGFDASFTSAGDDVDVCWKLLDAGHAIGFAPAAQVRHHRRSTVRAYLRQQRGYGRAERMVSGRHRHRFNRLGQARWRGFIYGGQRVLPSLLRPVVYHGYHGHAPFQPVVSHRSERVLGWISALMPLLVPLLAVAGVAAPFSPVAAVAFASLVGLVAAYAVAVGVAVRPARDEPHPLRMRALVALMHVVQPVVRASSRVRARPLDALAPGGADWQGERAAWLGDLGRRLAEQRCTVATAGPTSRHDLRVSVGPLLACQLTTAVLWSWTPASRVSFRLTPLSVVFLVAMGALAIGGTVTEAVLCTGAFGLLAAGEWWALRRRVERALDASTSGAR
jgi:glycosyltransferase involved in cell wall biosynthesis